MTLALPNGLEFYETSSAIRKLGAMPLRPVELERFSRARSASATGADRRDARLLLTAVCLHLQSRSGPDATVSDLVECLGAGGCGAVLAKLDEGPLSLTEYAVEELGSSTEAQQSAAVELVRAAAQLVLVVSS